MCIYKILCYNNYNMIGQNKIIQRIEIFIGIVIVALGGVYFVVAYNAPRLCSSINGEHFNVGDEFTC